MLCAMCGPHHGDRSVPISPIAVKVRALAQLTRMGHRVTDEEFAKLNSADAYAYLARQPQGERSRLFQLYKDRVGIDPRQGPTSSPSSAADRWSREWKVALAILVVGGGLVCTIGTCTISRINASPPPPTASEVQHGCDLERSAQDRRNAERQKAQAALSDAETALSATTPELKEYYQRAIEREMGLLPGEGRGWRTVYAGRKRDAERLVQSLGALEVAQPAGC